ncbi:MAG: response regulator [Desulfobulbaceae bacterium]|nr:response regulator [Desulfobulbaceae bacterium]
MLPGRATAAATQAKQIKVLIVEDEFISRYLLQEFLTPYGSSHVAIDGYEAILAFKNALIEKKPYDLVCLDIMMPGLDGRQVAKEIRRLESEMGNGISCKVVMTTALDDVKIKGEMLAAHHCDAYLTKPLRFDELIELLKKYFPAALPAEMLG